MNNAANSSIGSVFNEPYTLITGGAGFIGTNLAHRLLTLGRSVLLFDNLARPGVEHNLRWLREQHGLRLQSLIADVRDVDALCQAVRGAESVFHFAAQVAVTSSLLDPAHDFQVNVGGTLNLLEALRARKNPPPLVFTSTNKVYGALDDVALSPDTTRYMMVSRNYRDGVDETCPLDFHSPYGCSKGAADQYVLDYARSYGLPNLVFRMSCIYGPHQFGTEDQGWVAHFVKAALEGQPITLYGDGMQVRDVLFVDDLVDAFLLAEANAYRLSGHAYNIGGGMQHTVSLLELIALIEQLHGHKPLIYFNEWRTGDQRYYVSDTRKFRLATGWTPHVTVQDGVQQLYQWLAEARSISSGVGRTAFSNGKPNHRKLK